MKKFLFVFVLLIFLSIDLWANPVDILMIVTSAGELKKADVTLKTGCWCEELVEPYLLFTEAGFNVTIASVQGGKIQFDPAGLDAKSIGQEAAEKYQSILNQNPALASTKSLSEICEASDFPYRAVFLVGGHGTISDFYNNAQLTQILEKAHQNKAILAGVCHGVVGFLNLKDQKILEGAKITGFSNKEEELIKMTELIKGYLGDTVQNLLDQMVKSDKGGGYVCGEPWLSHVVNHENWLITGQNPASSKALAQEIIRVLK